MLKANSCQICSICFIIISLSSVILCNQRRGNLMQENDEEKVYVKEAATSVDTGNQKSPAEPESIKKELKKLISHQVDKDNDGKVSYQELKDYLIKLHDINIEFNVNKQWIIYSPQIHEVFSWEGYEPERKEVLTWDHYYNQTYPELIGVDVGVPLHREQDTSAISDPSSRDLAKENKAPSVDEDDTDPHLKMLKLMVHRADTRWKLADENGDTLLTKDEFKNLLHPDEGHDGLKDLFVREATEDMDLNKDGKICLNEFMKHLQVLATDQERSDKSWLSGQQENFGRFLDKNKDGVLDEAEIRNWLVPSKTAKYEAEAKRLLDIGDNNDDHKLTIAEILDDYNQYLNLLPAEYWADLEDVEEHDDSTSKTTSTRDSHDEL